MIAATITLLVGLVLFLGIHSVRIVAGDRPRQGRAHRHRAGRGRAGLGAVRLPDDQGAVLLRTGWIIPASSSKRV
jgi:hypothetical protein